MSLSFSVFLLAQRLSPKLLNKKGWLAAAFLACSTTCFVFSLTYTHAANTLVIIATSPLLAAIVSSIFLKERVARATWVAIIIAICGVALSLLDGFGRNSLVGELFALGSAISMACHFSALRWWKSPHGPLVVWGAGFLAALAVIPMAKPLSLPREDMGWMLLLGALVLPVAFGCMAVGPRYLPAPEVGLLLLGETVLGPLWVWVALKERPGNATLAGGAIVVATLFLHSLHRRRQERGS